MTRVLQAMAGAAHGGAESFFERLIPALDRAGLEQRAVIRRNSDRTNLLRGAGVQLAELRFGGRLDMVTRAAFGREINAFHPDVVFTWMSRATRFCPCGPFVHVARLGGYYNLKYYRACDHLVANTRDIATWMVRKGWPADRVHYLPNFVADTAATPVARERLDTPTTAPLLLALGRLHPNKGFDILLAALQSLPKAWLWLAGDGPSRLELETRADQLGVAARIRFLGWCPDAAGLLAAADILVCPSRVEPLGNVVLEGWAYRTAVVAAASAGPSGLITDGENGLLVPIDDADALATAIGRIGEDEALRQRLVAGGRASYEAEFTETAVVPQYLSFLERVVR